MLQKLSYRFYDGMISIICTLHLVLLGWWTQER